MRADEQRTAPHERQPVDHAGLVDAMAEGMYVVDTSRRITFWNRSAGRITGYAAETALGRWCGDGLLNHVDEQGTSMCGARCPLRGTMVDGRTRAVRAYLHHADGHLVPVQVTASALRDPEGDVIGAVETFTDDSAMRSTLVRLEEAEHLAATDPLTGLGNRRHLDGCLAARMDAWAREGRLFGALMVDLDRFKGINDAAGHAGGDAVLRTVARSITAAVTEGDDVCRYGGDEFVVLATLSSVDELVALGSRIRMMIGEGRYHEAGGLTVTASVGVALVGPGDAGGELLVRAGRTLLDAKRGGRDATIAAG